MFVFFDQYIIICHVIIALKDDDNGNENNNIIDSWWTCEVKENGGTLYLSVFCRLRWLLKSVFWQKLHE